MTVFLEKVCVGEKATCVCLWEGVCEKVCVCITECVLTQQGWMHEMRD